jgi:hypothetical protein
MLRLSIFSQVKVRMAPIDGFVRILISTGPDNDLFGASNRTLQKELIGYSECPKIGR